MIPTSQLRRAAPLAVLAFVLPASCELEPETPELRYELNEEAIATNEALAADPRGQAHLRGVLEMLYGTPEAPGYMLLEDWVDEEYDPNARSLALSDEEFDALKADNRVHFAQQIEAIEEGRFDELQKPLHEFELWRRWKEHLARKPEDPDALDEGGEYTWRENAIYIWESFYPTFAESAEMFRQQCMHCHGVSGGGDGSTSAFLKPPPRDYRAGIFKFTALNNKARPRHADLMRILEEGIYTTAMPSFRRFADSQLHGLADYVELLAKRGETEILLVGEYEADGGFGIDTVKEIYELVFERWDEGTDEVIAYDGEVPESTPERVAHGRELFMDEKGANCVKCHGQNGRGSYDEPRPDSAWERVGEGHPAKTDWRFPTETREIENAETGEVEEVEFAPVRDDWGNPIEVRDLSRGIFRFGRRPIDLYRRIYAGINGTPMPAHYGMQITEPDGTQRPLDEDDVWDLVHYVRSLSAHQAPHVAQATGSEGHGR